MFVFLTINLPVIKTPAIDYSYKGGFLRGLQHGSTRADVTACVVWTQYFNNRPMRHRKDILTEVSLIRTGTFYYHYYFFLKNCGVCREGGEGGGGGRIWAEGEDKGLCVY